MKVRRPYRMPDDKEEKLRRAKRLEWATLFFMATIITLLYFVMGSSQAMKAAWIEDLLSLVPAIAFLIAVRLRTKSPDENYPYGYRRAVSIAFLVASLALFFFGGYLLVDAVIKLIHAEHTTIGMVEIFGQHVWLGWLMIAALAYSAIPPVILGHKKLPLACELHEKVLYTDAKMNKADWLTAIAGILGILGIGAGWWWADSVAAGIISLDILKDGLTNLKGSVVCLMDKTPTTVEKDEPHPLPERLRRKLEEFDWVERAQVRLREEGDVFTGEAFVIPKDERALLDKLEQATDAAHALDWRIYDVVVTPVREFKGMNETNKKD